MAHKIHERRAAREGAVALLYSGDIAERDVLEIVNEGSYPSDDFELSDYAEMLIEGVRNRLEDIDAQLASTSENWALDRMPVVDRAILRVAVYEMLFVADVPTSVAINEAVELAKAYGGEDESARFVNGVLGRIARSLNADAASGEAEAGDAEIGDKVEAGDAEGADEAETAFASEPAADGEAGLTEPDSPLASNDETPEDSSQAPCETETALVDAEVVDER